MRNAWARDQELPDDRIKMFPFQVKDDNRSNENESDKVLAYDLELREPAALDVAGREILPDKDTGKEQSTGSGAGSDDDRNIMVPVFCYGLSDEERRD